MEIDVGKARVALQHQVNLSINLDLSNPFDAIQTVKKKKKKKWGDQISWMFASWVAGRGI